MSKAGGAPMAKTLANRPMSATRFLRQLAALWPAPARAPMREVITRRTPILPILTLTLAAFAIGVTEFAVQGLLPEIAADLGVSIPATGLLVTGYALGVAIGGPIVAVAINRLQRKSALLLLLGVFVAGHAFGAMAASYSWLLFARVVTSCAMARSWASARSSPSASRPEHRRAGAVALMWAGIASANILGVPAGTLIGHAFGWRATFWAIGGIGLVASAAIALWLPDAGRGALTRLASEVRVLGRPQVLLALSLCACVCAATFSVFTFIAPLLIEVTGVSPVSLPLYLFLFGVGGVDRHADRRPLGDRNLIATIIGGFIADFAVYLVLLAACHSAPTMAPAMFLWGFAFYFIAAPLQLADRRGRPRSAQSRLRRHPLGVQLRHRFWPRYERRRAFGRIELRASAAVRRAASAAGVGLGLWSRGLARRARAVSLAGG